MNNMNNYLTNNYQPFLLKNQMYPAYNMNNLMYINYFKQQQQNNNINNLDIPFIPNNNKNSININEKLIKENSNLHDLKIDIEPNALNLLNKENLIDIILFIQDFCKIKIEPKFTHIRHNIFRIRNERNNDNGHIFFITKNNMNALLNQKNIKYDNHINENFHNNSDNSSDDDNDEKNNIINEKTSNCIKPFENIANKNNNNLRYFYCEIHEKVYFYTNKKLHYMKHLKCNKCGLEFISKRKLRDHNREQHQEFLHNNDYNNKINIPEKNQLSKQNLSHNMNEDEIKCSECDLKFNTIELMSDHYYKIHENNKKEKEEKKVLEQIKSQEEEKKEEKKRQKEKETIPLLKAQKERLEPFDYECYLDKQKFGNKKEYLDHFYKFHKGHFPFCCKYCNKKFRTYFSLKDHSRAKGH
jgi:hypothetical protein